MEDPSSSTLMLQPSYQRAAGWPEHFERELDELRILGVLGFELRGFGPRPPHQFRSGAIYTGQWCGNQRHGFGRQVWPDGAQYEGCWSNSSACGLGRFKFPDGSVYLGHWRGNRFHGLGAHYLADGSSYHGQWVHGSRDGVGVETCSSSADGAQASVYWGDFCRGQKDGSGICEWEEGSRYAGQWRAGLISGHGALTSDSGSRKYRGQWVHSKKHGRGVYTWPDGREHRGQYQLDTASGFGTFSWPDGKQYHGFWHNAHIIGPGVFSAPGHSDRPMEVDVNLFPAELKAELANQLDAMPLLGTLPSQSEQGELERTPDTKHRSLGITKADSQDAGVKSSVRQRTTANPFATVATPLRRFLAARGGA